MLESATDLFKESYHFVSHAYSMYCEFLTNVNFGLLRALGPRRVTMIQHIIIKIFPGT